MNLCTLFNLSTRYSPDTNLGLLPKPAGRLFYQFGCQRDDDPVVQSFCSVSMEQKHPVHTGWQRSYPLLAS